MKKIMRILSAVLSSSLLASVVTVAPLSVSATETRVDTNSNITIMDSNAGMAVNETESTKHPDNEQNNKSAEPIGASEEFEYNSYKYTISNEKITITGYIGSESILTIPNIINNYTVDKIGNGAFTRCTGITSVTIPDSVTEIGSEAFYGCTGLTSVTLPSQLKTIRGGDFNGSGLGTIRCLKA